MTLLPERFREGWVAICAYSEGAAMHVRRTLEMGDILRPISAPPMSLTMQMLPTVVLAGDLDAYEEQKIRAQRVLEDYTRRWVNANTVVVGRDVSVADLYPSLWDDWRWVDIERNSNGDEYLVLA
jgi:hypothetical protein